MKIKVSFFSKTLWRQYLTSVSVISVFASLLFVAIQVHDKYKPYVLSGIVVALILGYIIAWIIANATTSKRMSINGSPLEVKIGDIFQEGELRAINFNEYFDTIVDDVLIAKKSLNGIYLNNYANDIKTLDLRIENDNHLAEMRASKNDARKIGKKQRYSLGSTYVDGDYLLVAFSKFDDNNMAHLTMRDYINCLMTFWDEVNRVYASRSLAIPLMGAGITRFDDAAVSEQELLELLIWSFKVSRVKFKHPAKVTIVIHKNSKDKINFYELKI